jgi:hypothetical protein
MAAIEKAIPIPGNYDESQQIGMIRKLQQFNVIKRIIKCAKCKFEVVMLQTRSRNKDSKVVLWTYRCDKCHVYNAAFQDSFFSMYKTPFAGVILLMKLWAAETTITKAVSTYQFRFGCSV